MLIEFSIELDTEGQPALVPFFVIFVHFLTYTKHLWRAGHLPLPLSKTKTTPATAASVLTRCCILLLRDWTFLLQMCELTFALCVQRDSQTGSKSSTVNWWINVWRKTWRHHLHPIQLGPRLDARQLSVNPYGEGYNVSAITTFYIIIESRSFFIIEK